MLQPNEIVRDKQGVERCQRIVEAVLANDAKDPMQGFKKVRAHCNKPVTLSISEGGKTCPSCEKQPPIGWASPRVTNAAGVRLTPKELEECGVTDGEDPSLKAAPVVKPVRAQRKPREAKPAVEAKVKKEVKKDVVLLEVPLSVLEENADVAATLIEKTIEAFGQLPVTNFAESKRLIKLEEKLRSMLGA